MSDHIHTAHCQDLLAAMSDYIDGELDPGVCAELEAHLAGCENCRIVVDTTRKTVLVYRRLGPPDALPPDVTRRLWAARGEAGCGHLDDLPPASTLM